MNLSYLFTYLKYQKLNIQNTTKTLENGDFSYFKR